MRKILSILLSVCVILAFMPQMAFAADPATNIPYLDASGAQKTCDNATAVTEDDTTWGTDGQTTWYVAQGDVTIESRVTVKGTVNLILKDECTLNALKGIEVSSVNDLTIYAQSVPKFNEDGTLATNNTAGILNATGAERGNVGIGSSVGGRITINGGYVVATGHEGIGGKEITINDGVVMATGNEFTGIEGNTTISGGTVRATGNYGGAGIGGIGRTVTIRGGSVEAIANGNGAGIGGDTGKLSGPIVISGGAVNATSKNGAGIGGGFAADFGDITISGGVVTATSTNGAGIGGGFSYEQINDNSHIITISGGVVEANSTNGSGIGVVCNVTSAVTNHNVIISGGTVKASSDKGVGIGFEGQTNSTFSTTDLGNAVVFAKSIVDQTGKNNWRGVFFEGTDDGMVYGSSVTPTDNFTIPNGKTLTIDSGKTLIIPDGVTLTDNGTIENNGKIYVDGIFTGTADNLYYPLTLVDATASGYTSEYNSNNYAKAGSTITLSAESQVGKIITWESSPIVDISNNSFTMPKEALTVTAQWTDCLHTGTLTHTPPVAPTYSEYGVKEYWTCSTCNANFSDAEGITVITDLESWKAGEGKIDKLTVPTKTDSLTTDKDGSVTVTLERSVTTSDSKTTATVTDTVVNQILARLASSETKSVVIDASAGTGTSTSVVISEASLAKLAEVDGIEITLVTENGRVVLDSKAIASVSASAGSDGQVTLNVETVEKSNNLLKVELTISTSSGYVTDFNGGKVTVTVVIDDELKGKNPVAVYIDDNGRYYKIGGKLNEDGTFTFVTGHFSTYAVMPEAEADKMIKNQEIAAVKSIKSTVTLTTKNIKRGIKVSVKIPASQKADKTGIIIYRSLKKNSGYAMYKKVKTSGASYTVTNTLNVKGNRLVKGKRYYYKARVYKVIDGKTYYGPMSSIKYIRAK